MTDILTQFFNTLSGDLSGVAFFFGFLSLYVAGFVLLLLINPIME